MNISILISFISWVIASGFILVWLFSYVWCPCWFVSFWYFRVFFCSYYFPCFLESNVFGVFHFGYIFSPFPDFTIFGICGVIFFLQLVQNVPFWQSMCFVLFSPHLPHTGGQVHLSWWCLNLWQLKHLKGFSIYVSTFIFIYPTLISGGRFEVHKYNM